MRVWVNMGGNNGKATACDNWFIFEQPIAILVTVSFKEINTEGKFLPR